MINLAWFVSAAALAVGLVLGVRALIDPAWAARLVRLQPDAQGGGFAEFRATYGGVFAGVHAAALAFVAMWLSGREPTVGALAVGAVVVPAAAWGGAAFGRAIAILRDPGADTRYNRISCAVELVIAALIGLPWIVWVLE